jgi:hypothetical protein
LGQHAVVPAKVLGCLKVRNTRTETGVRDARVWHALLGVEKKTAVEDVEFDELDQVLVVRVRPARGATRRCGVCGVAAAGTTPVKVGAVGGRWIWARCSGVGGRRAAGVLPRARRGGVCALGQARRGSHVHLR